MLEIDINIAEIIQHSYFQSAMSRVGNIQTTKASLENQTSAYRDASCKTNFPKPRYFHLT